MLEIRGGPKASHEWLAAVGKLHRLERLCLDLRVCSDDVASLGGLTNLKALALQTSDRSHDGRVSHELFATVGKLTQLEELSLWMYGLKFRADDLASLGGLTNLKSLTIKVARDVDEESEELGCLPLLPRLETLNLRGVRLGDQCIRRLTHSPRLKAINLSLTLVSDASLAELASLQALEELWIDQTMATPAVIESLAALGRLRAIHVGPALSGAAKIRVDDGSILTSPDTATALRRSLRALRQSSPSIVIDTDFDFLDFESLQELGRPSECSVDRQVNRGGYHAGLLDCISEGR